MNAEDLKLAYYPNPVLRERATEVDPEDPRYAEIGARMLEIMREYNGVGLAGPQVGLTERIFVLNVTGEPEDDLIVLNPEVVEEDEPESGEEGCLSLPGITGEIRRPAWIKATFVAPGGTRMEVEADELFARAFQHELDHLNGVLIIDKWTPSDQMSNKARLKELEAEFAASE